MDQDLTDSRGDPPVRDLNQYFGMTYETQVFNGSATVTDTITDPYTSTATASHLLTGLPTLKAFHTGTADTKVYTPLADGTTRETETDNSYDSYGRVLKVNDHGDVGNTTDDLCTTTSYADNTTAWILDTPSEVSTVSVNCSTTPSLPADVVSDNLAFYDTSTTLGAAPTVGDVTMTKKVSSYSGTAPSYLTTNTLTVDQYGRTRTSTDGDNQTTRTSYSPATGAEPTTITTLDPLLHVTTTTVDSLRDLPETVTDPAKYVTTEQYDALGRLTAVYKPNNPVAGSRPDLKYSYTVSSGAPSVVDTYTLNHDGSGYILSETLYDALLRAREIQTQTPNNGRDITDTFYNTDGWQAQINGPYYDPSPVGPILVQAQSGNVDAATGYTYDQAGRKTAQIAYHKATVTWQSTYVYGGNFTATIPPAGGIASTTVTDARGNTTDLIQYHAGVPVDYLHDPATDYDDTTYTYYPDGKQHTEHDPAGNQWSWQYNLLGEQTQANDPDTGTTTSTYDNAGQLTTVTDARGKQTTLTYDKDGRKTGAYDTTTTQTLSSGNAIATWTYDSIKTGLPTATTAYSAGDIYTSTITGYNLQGKPQGTTVTLTGTDAALVPSGGYTFHYGYETNGLPDGEDDPAAGDLPAEDLTYGFDNIDQPISLSSTTPGGVSWGYIDAVGYDDYGSPLRYTFGLSKVFADMTYDPQTRAITDISTSTSNAGLVDDLSYTYGNNTVSKGAGLLTETVDKQSTTVTDTQCYTYDYVQRLQQAWTATDGCAAAPQPGNSPTVGGPVAPYWQSWTYDAAGDRQTQTDHNTAGNTTTTYHYPTAGSATDQPHTLTNTTATGPAATQNTANYTYDPSGNTKTITGGALGDQTLTWNDQGKLATDTTSAGTTSYVYDASGNLLLRRDPGATTLYIGDEQIVLNTTTNALTATRYYTINGATIAARTGNHNATYLIPDRQGTNQLAVTSDTETVTRRQYSPFGQTRGTAPTNWPGDKGYVGGDNDPTTSLENLGAREYNPAIGRFISADPVFEAKDPQQLGGYSYASNNPVTGSDPTGEYNPTGCPDGNCQDKPPANPGGAWVPPNNGVGGGHHNGNGNSNCTYHSASCNQYTPTKGGYTSSTPAISQKTLQQLKSEIEKVVEQNPETWNVPGSPANKAIGVYVRKALYGSLTWGDVGHALGPAAASTIVALAGAALCVGTDGLGCLATVSALAAIAGKCADNCSDTESLAMSALISAIIPVPGMKPLSEAELATGERLMASTEYRKMGGGVLRQSPHTGADFVDENNVSYDAIGQPGAYAHWNQGQFLSALDRHVNYTKGDFTVLDLTGASSSQMGVIFSHIDSAYTPAQKATIIIVGD